MGEDDHCGFADGWVGVVEVLVEVLAVGLDEVGEAVEEVAHADDDVVFYHWVHVGFGQHSE